MSEAFRIVVPSDSWPSLAAAVADAEEGTHIHIQQGHSEVLSSPLIIDKAVHIVGPEGGHALIESEESVIIAPGKSGVVVLKRLELRIVGVPALIVAGGCHLEHCSIDGADVGVEVAAHAGSSVRIQGSVVQNCRLGISLSGGADAVMDGSQIQKCVVGCSVTGLVIEEGWNAKLGSVAKAKFQDNSDADLTLRGWSIQEKGGEGVRFSAPDGEVVVKGWPGEQCNVVAPTESGAVVLLFNGGQVNATLFEEEEEEDGSDDDSPTAESPSTAARTARAGLQQARPTAQGAGCGEPSAEAPELEKRSARQSFVMEEANPAPGGAGETQRPLSFVMEEVAATASRAGGAEPEAPEVAAPEPRVGGAEPNVPEAAASEPRVGGAESDVPEVPSPDAGAEVAHQPPRALV